MVIKTKNKIVMHNEYKILDFFFLFCLEIHRQLRWLLDPNTDLRGMSTDQNTEGSLRSKATMVLSFGIFDKVDEVTTLVC